MLSIGLGSLVKIASPISLALVTCIQWLCSPRDEWPSPKSPSNMTLFDSLEHGCEFKFMITGRLGLRTYRHGGVDF